MSSAFEALEQRSLLTLFTVNSLADSNPGGNGDILTLRDAVNQANATEGEDVIRFDESLFSVGAGTINISGSVLNLTDHVVIYGPGSEQLAIDANFQSLTGSGLFTVNGGVNATIYGVTIMNGDGNSGIHNAGVLQVDHVVIADNTSFSFIGNFGGGIANTGRLEVSNSTIRGNNSAQGGGLYNEGSANIINSTFAFNHATSNGGGIWNASGASLTLASSTISGNSANNNGGGIAATDGTIELASVTLVQNEADSDDENGGSGGGLHATAGSRITLKNTIIAGNTIGIDRHSDLDFPASSLNQTDSRRILVGDASSAAGIVHGFQRSIIGDGFGGVLPIDRIIDTQLRSIGGATDAHLLAANSPAIDGGDSSYAFFNDAATGGQRPLLTDQRSFGFDRVVNGDDDARAIIDIGAVEMQTGSVIGTQGTIVVSKDSNFDDLRYGPGELSLLEALNIANTYPDPNVIVFSDAIRGQIRLQAQQGQLTPTAKWDVTIQGPGARPFFTPEQLSQFSQAELDTLNADLDLSTLTVSANNASRLLTIEEAARVNISGLSFANGNANPFVNGFADGLSGVGGALVNFGTTTITDSVFVNNVSSSSGGAISNQGTLNLTNVTMANNQAAGTGGGLSNGGEATVTMTDVLVTGNTAVTRGGGLYNSTNGVMTLTSARVAGNTVDDPANGVDGRGGGIANAQGVLSIVRSEVTENYSDGHGGGIYSVAGPGSTGDWLTITRSNITNNQAGYISGAGSLSGNGGGIYTSGGGTVAITATTIDNNTSYTPLAATNGGGGLYAAPQGGTVTVDRSTISSNGAWFGGGMFLAPAISQSIPGSVVVKNSTVSGNTARPRGTTSHSNNGGGIYVDSASGGSVDILDNTIAFNGAFGNGGGIANGGIIRQLQNNIIAKNTSGGNGANLSVFGQDFINVSNNNGVTGQITLAPQHNLIGHYNRGFFDAASQNRVEIPANKNIFNLQGASGQFVDPSIDPSPKVPSGAVTATHALNADSPAIDAGKSTRILDQSGQSVIDVQSKPNGDAFGHDIGAFEAQVTSVSLPFESSTRNNAGGTTVSQFTASSNEVVYGKGFDDGRRPPAGTVGGGSGLDNEPGFLGVQFSTGNRSFGGIIGGCVDAGLFDICSPRFGAEVTANISAKIGLEYGYYVNAGSVEAEYVGLFDTTLNNVMNDDGSLNSVMIDTAARFVDGSMFTVSPRFGAYVDLVVEFSIKVSGKACLVGCISGNIINLDVDYSETLFSINRQLREGDDGAEDYKDADDVDYTGKKLVTDRAKKEPLFIDHATGNLTTDPKGGLNVPAFSGEVHFLEEPMGSLLKKATSKVYDKIKARTSDIGKAENAKTKNEKALSKTTDPAERTRLQNEISSGEKEIAQLKKDKEDEEKKKEQAGTSGVGLVVDFGEAEGSLLGVEATLSAGAKFGNVGVKKELGSLALTVPDVQLVDLELDNATGKLSATTDDFKEGSLLDDKRQIAKLAIDVGGIAGPLIGIPAGKYTVEVLGVEVKAQLVSYTIETTLAATQDVEVTPFFNDPRVTSRAGDNYGGFRFTRDVHVSVAGGTQVALAVNPNSPLIDHDGDDPDDNGFLVGDSGTPATPKVRLTPEIKFKPGQRVDVYPDDGQPVQVVPSLKVGNEFYNNIGLDLAVKGIFEALSLEIDELDLDIGPLFKDEHGLGDFDLGSVFSKRFDLSTGQATGLGVFTIGGGLSATMDGRTPGSAFHLMHGVSQNISGQPYPLWFSVPVTSDDGFAAFDRIDFDTNGSLPRSVVVAESGLVLHYLEGGSPRQVLLQPEVESPAFTGDFSISGILSSTTAANLLVGLTSSSSNNASSITATGDFATEVRRAEPPPEAFNFVVLEQANANFIENDLALDIDGDGMISPMTDGALLLRYMAPNNLRGNALIQGAVNPAGTRTTAAEIEAYIATLPSTNGSGSGINRLDINGGGANANEDGVQLIRHLSGLSDIDLDNVPDEQALLYTLDGTSLDTEFQQRVDAAGGTKLRAGADSDAFHDVNVTSDSVVGSSGWNPLTTSGTGSTFSVPLTPFGHVIQYTDTFVADATDPTLRTLIATGPVGSPARRRVNESEALFNPVNANNAAEVDAFARRVQMESRTAVLGTEEPIFVQIRDAAGYEFVAPAGFLFTELDFDTAAGDNQAYNHSGLEDGTETDFDLYLPDTDQWFKITVNPGDQPITIPGGAGVSRFQLYPRGLADGARRGLTNTELPDLQLIIGLGLTGTGSTPTVSITVLADREPVVLPGTYYVSDVVGSFSNAVYANEFHMNRVGAHLVTTVTTTFRDPTTSSEIRLPDPNRPPETSTLDFPLADGTTSATVPLSSIPFISFTQTNFSHDTLVVTSNAPIDQRINYQGRSSFCQGNNCQIQIGENERMPVEVDSLRVDGSGITIDLVNQYRLNRVSLVDIRGTGPNTLIVDATSLTDNNASVPELFVLVDTTGDGADTVDMSLSVWTKQQDSVNMPFNGTTYRFDVFRTPGQSFDPGRTSFSVAKLYISTGEVGGGTSSFLVSASTQPVVAAVYAAAPTTQGSRDADRRRYQTEADFLAELALLANADIEPAELFGEGDIDWKDLLSLDGGYRLRALATGQDSQDAVDQALSELFSGEGSLLDVI